MTGHRTRSDERDQANAYEQFHFSDRLSELGFEGLRRSIRDNSFAPFTELHPGPLQPVKLPQDATSAFSALATGKLLACVYFLLRKFGKFSSQEMNIAIYRKAPLDDFHVNGRTLGFRLQTETLEPAS